MIDLRIPYSTPLKLYSDNKFAINIGHQNPGSSNRTKHIEIDCCFIKEKIEEGIISLSYVSTKLPKLIFLPKLYQDRDSDSL